MDNLERTNRALFSYLEKHGRLPQKGLLNKRQVTWDELVSDTKKHIAKDGLPEKYVEQQLPEYLNIYLRLTFSVDGWWREREVMLLLSGHAEEVAILDGLFRQHPLGV